MNHNLQISLLSDTSQLQAIYELRVDAYENSHQAIHVNKTLYPTGWSDDLDEKEGTFHWIVKDKNKIVAAARLATLQNLSETDGEFEDYKQLIPLERPFVYWSRLVVHPNYRRQGIMMELDKIRKSFLMKNPQFKFALTSIVETRNKYLLELGFEHLGDTLCEWNGTSRKFGLFIYRNCKAKTG